MTFLIILAICFTVLYLFSFYFRELVATLIEVALLFTLGLITMIFALPILIWDKITNKEDKDQQM